MDGASQSPLECSTYPASVELNGSGATDSGGAS